MKAEHLGLIYIFFRPSFNCVLFPMFCLGLLMGVSDFSVFKILVRPKY